MKAIKVLLLTLCVIGVYGCGGLQNEDHLIGKCYLGAVDIAEETAIYYKESEYLYSPIVRSTVFAVGFDNNFIIAKQHPFAFPNVIDRSVTNFYIVAIDSLDSLRPEKCVIGPLTEEQFLQKRGELSVPNELSFTITNEDLE